MRPCVENPGLVTLPGKSWTKTAIYDHEIDGFGHVWRIRQQEMTQEAHGGRRVSQPVNL